MTYFTPQTDPKLFSCGCGVCRPPFVTPTPRLLEVLNALRVQYGAPILVTSGPRCPAKNTAVGGADTSEHLTGEGADLWAPDGLIRYYLVRAAFAVGASRIEVTNKHIHIGVSETLPQHVLWPGVAR